MRQRIGVGRAMRAKWECALQNPCNTPPYGLGAVGIATLAVHCLSALRQGAVELLQCTAHCQAAVGSEWNPCNRPPHG